MDTAHPSTATRKSKVKSQKSSALAATKSKVLIGKGFMIFGLVTYFRRAALVQLQDLRSETKNQGLREQGTGNREQKIGGYRRFMILGA